VIVLLHQIYDVVSYRRRHRYQIQSHVEDHIPTFMPAMYSSLDLEYCYKQCINEIGEVREESSCGITIGFLWQDPSLHILMLLPQVESKMFQSFTQIVAH
jgi:hypothetical protein